MTWPSSLRACEYVEVAWVDQVRAHADVHALHCARTRTNLLTAGMSGEGSGSEPGLRIRAVAGSGPLSKPVLLLGSATAHPTDDSGDLVPEHNRNGDGGDDQRLEEDASGRRIEVRDDHR